MTGESDGLESQSDHNYNIDNTQHENEHYANMSQTPPLLNVCIAFIRCLMITKDKQYISNETCAGFDLSTIKKAREILFKYCDPNTRYVYQGQRKDKSVRDKATHAFEGIFNKLRDLDAENITPKIACPAEELHLMPPIATKTEGKLINERFERIETTIDELKSTLQTMAVAHTAPGIPPNTRDRLISEISVKGSSNDANEVSYDTSESEIEIEKEPYVLPKSQRKKIEKQEKRYQVREENILFSSVAKSDSRNVDIKKKKSIWGKVKVNTSCGLSGAVSDIFMHNCRVSVEENDVQDHLVAAGLNISKVKKASHENSVRRSFIISVASRDDYEKLLSGDYIPLDVGVRKYIPPKRRNYDKPSETGTLKINQKHGSTSIENKPLVNEGNLIHPEDKEMHSDITKESTSVCQNGR